MSTDADSAGGPDSASSDDIELGPFSVLYQECHPKKQDPVLIDRLRASYRDAWKKDVGLDRYSVLDFVYWRKVRDGADLIVEGLRSGNRLVANHAATLACVSHGRQELDLGPDLRPAYRALVRRFPEADTIRPRDLYGHQPDDVDDRRQRPFVNHFEDWMADDYPRNPVVTQQLVEMYRAAWAAGDGIDKAFVLHFLMTNRRPVNPHKVDGRALLVEALQTQDEVLAETAAFAADAFIRADGIDLGPGTRELLQAFVQRFPDTDHWIRWVLHELDKRQS